MAPRGGRHRRGGGERSCHRGGRHRGRGRADDHRRHAAAHARGRLLGAPPQGARRQGGLGLHLRGGEGGGAQRCRRRRRAQSANGSPEGTPSGAALNGEGLLSGRFAAALSGLGADASASATTAKTPFATAGAAVVATGVDDAPARPSMAERLSGVSATAKAFTPAAKGSEGGDPGLVGRAHRRAHARDAPRALRARRRARRRGAGERRERRRGRLRGDHAGQRPRGGERHAGGVLRRARARGGRRGGGGAGRGAGPRARAKIVAANAAAKKKLAPAPAVAVADDAAEAPVASFSAPAPRAWGVSFASVLRAV